VHHDAVAGLCAERLDAHRRGAGYAGLARVPHVGAEAAPHLPAFGVHEHELGLADGAVVLRRPGHRDLRVRRHGQVLCGIRQRHARRFVAERAHRAGTGIAHLSLARAEPQDEGARGPHHEATAERAIASAHEARRAATEVEGPRVCGDARAHGEFDRRSDGRLEIDDVLERPRGAPEIGRKDQARIAPRHDRRERERAAVTRTGMCEGPCACDGRRVDHPHEGAGDQRGCSTTEGA
jgi:hypothetical protein